MPEPGPAPAPAPQAAQDIEDASPLTIAAWRVLEDELKVLDDRLDGPVLPILDFLKSLEKPGTPVETRHAIVDQALLLFEHFYVHLPFKREIYSGNPEPAALLRQLRQAPAGASEVAFHRSMMEAFATVRDAHTSYVAPSAFRRAIAFLPFQVATIVDPTGERRFIVHRVMAGEAEDQKFGHPFFGPGAEILEWSGLAIADHLRNLAMFLPAATDSAAWTRATTALTLRPLGSLQFPFDDELPSVKIVYRAVVNEDPVRTIRIPWGVARFEGPAD
jgi:hypothetical protein